MVSGGNELLSCGGGTIICTMASAVPTAERLWVEEPRGQVVEASGKFHRRVSGLPTGVLPTESVVAAVKRDSSLLFHRPAQCQSLAQVSLVGTGIKVDQGWRVPTAGASCWNWSPAHTPRQWPSGPWFLIPVFGFA